jgi:putative Holliday junction resolvase
MARVMALDVGARRVGVALSDAAGRIAAPHATLANRGVRRLAARIIALCRARQVALVVVGLPVQADGAVGAAARLPLRVADEIRAAGIAAELWDESFTSDAARSLLAGNVAARRARAAGVVDRVAAALILQSYLESAARSADGTVAQGQTEARAGAAAEPRNRPGAARPAEPPVP